MKRAKQEFTFIKKKPMSKENEEPGENGKADPLDKQNLSNSVILNTTFNSNMDVETIKSSTYNECDKTMSSYATKNSGLGFPTFYQT